MEKSLCIRLTADEHRRIRAAAFSKGISVNAFVQAAAMAAVHDVEQRSSEPAEPTDFLLAGARNGPPGYRQHGADFARWLEKNAWPKLRELLEMLKVVDAEMLRREKFRPLFAWGEKHFPKLMNRIPQRRRRLFAEGLLETVKR
jgi:hypothetical protein